MQTRMIEIDFQVHQLIELERKGFEDTPNAVLRRKYGLADLGPTGARPGVSNADRPAKELVPIDANRPWAGKGKSTGLMLPHGTQLRIDYNGQCILGRVDNGSLVFEGQRFNSPSGAAVALCSTRSGRKTALNGKTLISACPPGKSRWASLKSMEEQLPQRRVHA